MRVIGFMPIYYGVEYLRESLESIKEHCEKVVVAYTANPSHGYGTNLQCPDSHDEILSICSDVLGNKLIFDYQHSYPAENIHRQKIYSYSAGYDLILSIDADEVFESKELTNALEYAYKGSARWYGIKGYLNFWRSFDYVCKDGFRPIRIEKINAFDGHDIECQLTVYHFSTAQSSRIMNFKYNIFGHASEIRANWLNDIYYKWMPDNQFNDVHCVAFGIWNPEPFDKSKLPESLKKHPNYNKVVI